MNKNSYIVAICIIGLFIVGWISCYSFLVRPLTRRLAAQQDTLERAQEHYENEVRHLEKQIKKSDNTQEEYDLAKAEYNRKAAEIDHRVDKMYRDVFKDSPYLVPVLGIAGLVIVLVVAWLLIESSSSRRAMNDLAEIEPELVKKLTGYSRKPKIIDVHSVQTVESLPKEESPDLLPKE